MSIELLSTVLWKNHSFIGFYFILRFFVLFLFLFFPFLFSVFLFFCLFVCLFVCFFLTFFIFFIFSCIIYVIKIQIPNEPCQIIPSPKPRKWKTCVLQGIIWLHLQNCASKKSGPLHIQWMSEWVSEWLLLNASSEMFQLYHGENKLIFKWNDDGVRFILDQHT